MKLTHVKITWTITHTHTPGYVIIMKKRPWIWNRENKGYMEGFVGRKEMGENL